jgi:hypothetical protein
MWHVKSFQSASATSAFDLDDGSNYRAYIEDSNRLQIMPTIKSVAITRGQYSPTIVGVNREMDKLVVTIRIISPDWRVALNSLLAAIPNDEKEPGTLTVWDQYTESEWTIQARVTNLMRTKFDKVYELHLDVPDLIWRKVATDDEWNITASAQTTIVTNNGNRKVRPTFTFKPTSVKADGFLYRHWIPVYNPNTERGFAFKGLDLTNGGLDTRPWVKDTTNYMQINNGAGITDSQTTIPYDTKTEADAGIIGTYGMALIDDGVHQEQIFWTGRTGTTSGNLTGVTRAIGGTTAYAFADNVKIYLSYAKADGSDVRVYKNSLEQNLWIDGFNTASTRIWIVASEPAGADTLELGVAIASSGDIDEIELKWTLANRAALNLLPTSGVIRFGTEAFHFTDRNPILFSLTIDARSINDTEPAVHNIGAAGRWIPNDYWLYSGNPFMDEQETNDTRKPIIDLDTSDNTTRAYTSFWGETNLRADSWKPNVDHSSYPATDKASEYYTGNQMDDTADPATEMGMLMRSIFKNGTWRYEYGRITWTLYEPAGINRVVTWIYEKYRTGASWPAYVRLEKSRNGQMWQAVATITSEQLGQSDNGRPAFRGRRILLFARDHVRNAECGE